jgi:hypothetical protein
MAGTTITASGTPVTVTQHSDAPPAKEADLAKRIEQSGLLTGEEPTEPRQKPAARTPARQAPAQIVEGDDTTTIDEIEIDDGGDAADTTDEPGTDAGEGEPTSEIAQLRKDIADLKAALAGKGKDAPITGDAGGEQLPPAKSDTTADRLAKVKQKLAQAKGTEEKPGDWKELIEAIGLDEIVEDLEAERTQRAQEKQTAEQARQQQEQQVRIDAANGLHKILNNASRADPELTKILGIGRHGTLQESHAKTRDRIMAASFRALQDSMEEVQSKQRKAPMTDGEALAIGIKRVTGKDIAAPSGTGQTTRRTATEQQAHDRARMVRASSGGSTSKESGSESPQETEARLASTVETFFKQQG